MKHFTILRLYRDLFFGHWVNLCKSIEQIIFDLVSMNY